MGLWTSLVTGNQARGNRQRGDGDRFSITQKDDQLFVRMNGGGNFSEAARYAIEVAKRSHNIPVSLEFNDTIVPISADDTLANLKQRFYEIDNATQRAFEASDEGKKKRYQQSLESQRSAQKSAKTLENLETLYSYSSFRVPENVPAIMGGEIHSNSEQVFRKQLCVGAQWMKENPDKKPFKRGWRTHGNEDDYRELKAFMDTVDDGGHSGSSFGFLMGQLRFIYTHGATIDDGFNTLMDKFQQKHSTQRSR